MTIFFVGCTCKWWRRSDLWVCKTTWALLYDGYTSVLFLCSTVDSWSKCKVLEWYCNRNNDKSHRKRSWYFWA